MARKNWSIYTAAYDGTRAVVAQCSNTECYKSKKREAQQQVFLIGDIVEEESPNCTQCKQPLIATESIPEVLTEYHGMNGPRHV